jgi:hypothetical protein
LPFAVGAAVGGNFFLIAEFLKICEIVGSLKVDVSAVSAVSAIRSAFGSLAVTT